MPNKKLLFVCTGNTCRSSMAAALARRALAERGLTGRVEVISAGLFARPGDPASPRAVAVMGEWGIDLHRHRARQLTPRDVAGADLVLVMTAGHHRQVRQMVPEAGDRIHTLAAYAGVDADVPDPFGRPLEAYRRCAVDLRLLVERAVDRLAGEWFSGRTGGRGAGPA
ncbi:low molecular weight protein arginine phosphatase [Desulfotomaculum copahuensis]|uniref:low molecular weight protein arginine phosphatase n=1 Tax=Desulfotomaculum copahuensis TaxID=1838280 RepID=UPI001FA77C74|nr:low molecular weight protein arginine phosphatase [Desulfotomaculum copahuensis]